MAATGFLPFCCRLLLWVLWFDFWLISAFASKVFPVTVDERIEKIIKVLPGANCACGQPGCSGYATAIVNEGKDLNFYALLEVPSRSREKRLKLRVVKKQS